MYAITTFSLKKTYLKTDDGPRSAQNRLATIRLPYAGPTTSLKSAKSRQYERRPLADFRLVVGPAYGSRMVANKICADRVYAPIKYGCKVK
jgi:hypothetical protein